VLNAWQRQHLAEVADGALQFLDGITGQILRLGQIVGVVEGLFFQPLEAVELELALFHLADWEAAPAVFLRV
jgi:hypothetical protein